MMRWSGEPCVRPCILPGLCPVCPDLANYKIWGYILPVFGVPISISFPFPRKPEKEAGIYGYKNKITAMDW